MYDVKKLEILKFDWTRDTHTFLNIYKFNEGEELPAGQQIFCKVINHTFVISKTLKGILSLEIIIHNEHGKNIKLPKRIYNKEITLVQVIKIAEDWKDTVVTNFIKNAEFYISKWTRCKG